MCGIGRVQHDGGYQVMMYSRKGYTDLSYNKIPDKLKCSKSKITSFRITLKELTSICVLYPHEIRKVLNWKRINELYIQ